MDQISSVDCENSSNCSYDDLLRSQSSWSGGKGTLTPPTSPASSVVNYSNKEYPTLFKPDELKQHLSPNLEMLYRQEPYSIPFRVPVDPCQLNIPDYFDIIKKPMDLSTIKRKLDTGQYSDPWDYVDDVWLMFNNAWIYNLKSSIVYTYCTKLAEIFEKEIDPVMQKLGYCCGHQYTLFFKPQALRCYGKKLCIIPRDAMYYMFQNKYAYCDKCFNDIPGEVVVLNEDHSSPSITINKSHFQEFMNDGLELEPWVQCIECGRKQHQMCVLYMQQIWSTGFVCDLCLKRKGHTKIENKYSAQWLQTTELSKYLENRVNDFLKRKEAGAGKVIIRVVSCNEKSIKVKAGMKARFVDSGQLSAEFPYRAKVIFAFEEIDRVEVSFFGLHVQEYGSECPSPNTRRVYLAHLDSVHYFEPRQYRTAVYHEILLGYLEYVKQLGYTMAHIWAIPCLDGGDYIFHAHPSEQKIPRQHRLHSWCRRLLDKGLKEGIVFDYKDIKKQALEDHIQSPAELPYFEGDYWPLFLEECIAELEQEEKIKLNQISAEGRDAAGENERTGTEIMQRRTKCRTKRKNKMKMGWLVDDCSTGLARNLEQALDRHKEEFFVIWLHSAQSAVSLPPIQDPDPNIACDLMDGRENFLSLAKEQLLEFSSLRRAKFSTMVMLYEMHRQRIN